MKYKRKEAFRYQFRKPLACQFKIIKVNRKEVTSKTGKGYIHDLSPSGAKVSTKFNLLGNDNEIEVELHFVLHSDNIVRGKIVWQKMNIHGEYVYGIHLLNKKEEMNKIVNELKTIRSRF